MIATNLSILNDLHAIAIAKYQIEIWLLKFEELYLYQDKIFIIDLEQNSLSFTVEFGKLIFSFWTDDRSECWRVVSYELAEDSLKFSVITPLGDYKNFILLTDHYGVDNGIDRDLVKQGLVKLDYLKTLAELIKAWQINIEILRCRTGRNDRYGYRSHFARWLFALYGRKIAGISLANGRDEHNDASLISEGINWVQSLLKQRVSIKELFIFAPLHLCELIAERLTVINSDHLIIRLFEIDINQYHIAYITPFDQGELALRFAWDSRLPKRVFFEPPSNFIKLAEKIKPIDPSIIEIHQHPWKREWWIEINGLRVVRAHYHRLPVIEFGVDQQTILTVENELCCIKLIEDVVQLRIGNSDNRQHQYYRILAESWLASLVRRDINKLDNRLIPDYIYSQVPVSKRNITKFLDLLAVRDDGQLVIIELKTSEDRELIFQGLDYWLRVEWHRKRGDFSRQGYFNGLVLKDSPAWIYLVAPTLRFHKGFSTLARYVDIDVPLFQIAINDQWRSGLKIFSRELISRKE